MASILELKPCHVIASVSWNAHKSNLSSFDNKLFAAWKEAVVKGYFRYKVHNQTSRIPGRWNFVAEFNRERGENRRKPQAFFSVNQPFNPSLFNFTHIKDEEVMFEIQIPDESQNHACHNLLAINVSPVSEGHSLIIPSVSKMKPQVLTQDSIELGLHLLLMSATPSFRVAFNSLCGLASVNHLHLHGIYIDHCMSLESADLVHLEGPCFYLNKYPGQGFAFQCDAKCEDDVKALARNVFKLTSFFHSRNEAHNVMMTRSKLTEKDEMLSHVRVYVWVRTPSTGAKISTALNAAALELFGYFVILSEDSWKSATESHLSDILEELTRESFKRNYEHVRNLFID